MDIQKIEVYGTDIILNEDISQILTADKAYEIGLELIMKAKEAWPYVKDNSGKISELV